MADLTKKSLTEIVSLIKKKEIKSEEVTNLFIKNIENDKKLNSFITNCNEQAVKKAKIFDKNPKFDTLLPGIPIAVKDLFCTKGVKTTAGSKMLDNFIPNYESTITKNLWNEGAFLLGKLNCDEFAMGSSNETSFFGNVMNPVAENTVPGGSSGGSASALAADLTPTTIGTDTGGSIRQPASFTGTVGLKPTYGLCSRWGIVAFASSLDQAGPMTKTVEDCALMLEAMAGFDEKDIDVEVAGENLTISGNSPQEASEGLVHQGLAARSFIRKFVLSDDMVVKGAALSNGMLYIGMESVIPEHQRPKKISLTSKKKLLG